MIDSGQTGDSLKTVLTYKNGVFALVGPREKLPVMLAKFGRAGETWSPLGHAHVTQDFKAAREFSQYADDKARRILDRAFVKTYSDPLAASPPFLDLHQKAGVRWILTRSRSYLAHAPGAGKTCEAVTAAILCKKAAGGQSAGKAIFIVPPSLTANWEREIQLWHGKLKSSWPLISIIPESQRKEFTGWGAEYLIVPDSMLTREWVLTRLAKMKKRFVGVDEASRFKEPSSQRTIALFGGVFKDGTKSPGLVHDARHAVLLDGSPMPNRPMELWAPLYAMSPETIDFMDQQAFGFRYCGPTINDYGRYEFRRSSHEEELRQKLRRYFMHVVTEDQLSHPERLRSILVMGDDVRSAEQKTWEKKNLGKLRLSDLSEDSSQGDLARFRRELGLKKVEWVSNYVRERLEGKNDSILLFAWHRDVVFELEKRLAKFKPIVIVGGDDIKKRDELFEEFQKGTKKLIIGNILAMGRGNNLQRADRAVFAEFSWSDETNKQAEKRASRKGRDQDLPVRCDYIVAPGSMDEPILSAVMGKEASVKKVIG